MLWEEERGQSLHDVLQTVSLVSVPSRLSVPSSGSRKDIGSCFLPGEKVYTPNPNESSRNALEKKQSVGTVDTGLDMLQQPITVVVFVGPEGGLLKEEVELAQRYGVHCVTLGTRILRAETAALVAVANVMYELEALWRRTV
jgi:RsmE family RNA methyltransferase